MTLSSTQPITTLADTGSSRRKFRWSGAGQARALRSASTATGPKLTPSPTVRSTQERPLRHRQVLVVGTIPMDFELLTQELAASQYAASFDEVPNATQALARLFDRTRPRPRAIVMAKDLPGASSASQLLGLLRARRELKSIPIFVYDTEYCVPTSRELYASGANGYLCQDAAEQQLAATLLQFEALAEL